MGSVWRSHRWSWRARRRPQAQLARHRAATKPWGPAFLYSAVLLVGLGVGLAGFLEVGTAPAGGGILPVLSGFLVEGERRLTDETRAMLSAIAPHGLVESAIPMFAQVRSKEATTSLGLAPRGIRSLVLALSEADLEDPRTFLTIGIPGFRTSAKAPPAAARHGAADRGAGPAQAPARDQAGLPDEASTLEHPPAGPGSPVRQREPLPPPVVVPRPLPAEPGVEEPHRVPTRGWGDEPLVFIYHSHSSEAYRLTSGADHVWGSEEGVIAVGAALAKALSEKYNIPVLHSRKIHDYPVWREAYINSYKTVSDALEKHPTIEMVLDVHRDAGTTRLSGPPTVEIGGRKAARVFIVVTTDRFGLPHPNWRENLAFAYYLNAKMDEMYPGLSRGINVRDDARWNQHVHNRAVILEIGCEQNTRQEAETAAALLADVIACVLEDIQR